MTSTEYSNTKAHVKACAERLHDIALEIEQGQHKADLFRYVSLEKQERSVIKTYARGLELKVCADICELPVADFMSVLDNAKEKLGVKTDAELVIFLIRAGIALVPKRYEFSRNGLITKIKQFRHNVLGKY